jgi:sigma-B regulation protein RsbU (phosphoserine phosphatase)
MTDNFMLFHLFTFFPVIGIGIILWYERVARRGASSRTLFLFFSLLIITMIGIFQAFTQSFKELFPPALNFQIIALSGFLFYIALVLLEYAIHARRIKESFLMPDFLRGLKNFWILMVIALILIVLSYLYYPYNSRLMGNPIETFLVPAGNRSIPLVVYQTNINVLAAVYLFLMFVLTLQATNSIFRLQEGVIRSRRYIFFTNFIVILATIIHLYSTKGAVEGVPPLYYFFFSNIIFMIRMVEEFFFWSMYNLRSDRIKIEQRQHDLNILIRRVISSPEEEDYIIVRETIESALSKAKSRMVVHEYNITGFLAFRVINNVLKVEDPRLLFGYCTPLVDNKNFKSLDKAKLNDMILRTTYDLNYLRTTPMENIKDYGSRLIKKVMDEKEPVIVSELPENFRGLQRMVGIYPILDSNNFVGAAVFFKDSFNQVYPVEKEVLNDLAENLGTIFALMNGKQIQKERNRLQGEMNTARNIQTSILPKKLDIPGYRVAATMQTATEVGGDTYDLVHHPNGNYLKIGDVSGHGLPAGMMATIEMAAFHGALETVKEFKIALTVDQLYDIVNRVLCVINRDRIGSDKFMTMNYFFEKDGKFIHAGTHEVALIYRANQDQVEEIHGTIDKTGFLGLSEYVVSTQSLGEFMLSKNDILVLYSDGVIEAKSVTGEQYDLERLKAIIQINHNKDPEEIIKELKTDLERWAKEGDMKVHGGHFADDVTVIVMKRE